MALCAHAQSKTATFGASSISGLDKDTDVPCEGFTLAGTYFAAGTSKVTVFGDDKGMKVRANKGPIFQRCYRYFLHPRDNGDF